MRVKDSSGKLVEQAVGFSCLSHHLVLRECTPWLTEEEFADKYQNDDAFAASADDVGEHLSNNADLPQFPPESVDELDQSFIVMKTPECYMLKAYEAQKVFPGVEGKVSLKQVTLPDPFGTGDAGEYSLVMKGDLPYPTVQLVTIKGSERRRSLLSATDNKMPMQARLLFNAQTAHRADLTQIKAFKQLTSADSLVSIRTKLGLAQPAQTSASAPPTNLAERVVAASSPRDAMDANAAVALEETRDVIDAAASATRAHNVAPSVRIGQDVGIKAERPAANIRRAPSKPFNPKASPTRAGEAGSAVAIDADECQSVAESLELEPDSSTVSATKSDYWIAQLDLHEIMANKQLGAPEYQAELRLGTLTSYDDKHPHAKKYEAETLLLQTHLKKVTCAKKLRSEAIDGLTDEGFGAAILGLGKKFQFGEFAVCAMLSRRARILRTAAMEKPSGANDTWNDFVQLIKPKPLDTPEVPFEPASFNFATSGISAKECSNIFRRELVEKTFVPLAMSDSPASSDRLLEFCASVLEEYESFWAELDAGVTKVMWALVSCARTVHFVLSRTNAECTTAVMADAEIYADLHAFVEAAEKTDNKSIKSTVGVAMLARADFEKRLNLYLVNEKNVMMASGPIQSCLDDLNQDATNSLVLEHLSALRTGCDLIVQWSGKIQPFIQLFADDVRERLVACGASALAYKHEAADGFTFEEVQEFQSVLEAADLAFSLDPDIVTLKDSVYQVVMKGQSAAQVHTIAKVINNYTIDMEDKLCTAAALPEQSLQGVSELNATLLKSRGLEILADTIKAVDSVLSLHSQIAQQLCAEPACITLLETIAVVEWLKRPHFELRAAITRSVHYLSVSLASVTMSDPMTEDDFKQAINVDCHLLRVAAAINDFKTGGGNEDLSAEEAQIFADAGTKTETWKNTYIDSLYKRAVETTSYQVVKWMAQADKEPSAKQVIEAYKQSGVSAKEVHAAYSEIREANKITHECQL